MAQNDSDFGNFLAGFIVGGLAGAAVALLLAPQSGEETRVAIRDKSIELKDRAVESAEETRVRAERALEDARMRADDAMAEVRVRADDLARITKERASELQHRGQEVFEEQRTKFETAVEAGKRAAEKARGGGASNPTASTSDQTINYPPVEPPADSAS